MRQNLSSEIVLQLETPDSLCGYKNKVGSIGLMKVVRDFRSILLLVRHAVNWEKEEQEHDPRSSEILGFSLDAV